MNDESQNRGVLFSIRPEWCEKILTGKKTLEIRKTRPKIEPPFKGFIYCTEGGDALALPHLNDPHYSIHRMGNGYLGGRRMTALDRERSNYTYANGKVVAVFVCDAITSYRAGTQFSPEKIPFSIRELGCMTAEQLWSYSGGKRVYGIHITDLKMYDEPITLTAFRRPCINDLYCESCAMFNQYSELCGNAALQITRPPQSWCYIEEMSDRAKSFLRDRKERLE